MTREHGSAARPSAVHGLLLVLAVGLASYVGTRFGVSRPLSPPSDETTSIAELRRIEATLERIAQTLAATAAPTSAPTQVAHPEKAVTTQATYDAIAVLDAVVTKLTASVAQMAETAKLTTTGRADLRVPDTAPDPSAWQTLKLGLDEDGHSSAYLLWSYQRILDTFGAPASARPGEDGSLKWYYGKEGEPQYVFWFKDGFITKVFAK